jgi:hypothetical protein
MPRCSELVGLSFSKVRDFEKGRRVAIPNNLAVMRAVLESQGTGFFSIENRHIQDYVCRFEN